MARYSASFLPSPHLAAARRNRWAAVGMAFVMGLFGAVVARAQTCPGDGCGYETCRIGVKAAPSYLWGDLEPTELGTFASRGADGRDASGFNEFKEFYSAYNWYMGVRSSGGYLFQGLAHGMSIWTPSASGVPQFVSKLPYNTIPVRAHGEYSKWPINGIAVAEERSDVAVLIGQGGMGVMVIDTATKSSPVVAYQDHGIDGDDVEVLMIGGKPYAAAATSMGVRIYDLETALECPSPTGCSNVLKPATGIASASVGGVGRYFAVGRRPSSIFGVTLYDLVNPASPVKKLEIALDEVVRDLAMWTAGGSTYMGVRTTSRLEIYDASCLSSGCTTLPKRATVDGLFNYGLQFLTLSKDNGRVYLHAGTENRCGWDASREPVQQMEYLFDVTNPASPAELTPPSQVVNGKQVGYWGWYYRANPNGFNYVGPRGGVVIDGQLHRAAMALYDVHRLTGGQAPSAGFSHPATIYASTPATFSDTSSGTVDSRSWTFPGATASSTTAANPSVTFSSPGPKQVSLTVSNAVGQDTATKSVIVLDPVPNVSSITVSPAAPTVCQPVTLTAGATGKPTLSYAWTIDGSSANGLGNGGSVTWSTDGLAAATYNVKVVATNDAGSGSREQPVTLQPLGDLPAAGFVLPAPPAYSGATVQFAVDVPGATEWKWSFGDGSVVTSTDPVSGPNPVHTYTAVGTYLVTVEVTNCLPGATPRLSATLPVPIAQLTPLEAGFQATGGIFCGGIGCSGEAGEPITFVDQSKGDPDTWSYDWDNTSTTCGSGNSFEQAGQTSPVTSHTYSSAGTFHPCLRLTRGAETDYHLHSTINVSAGVPASISVGGPSSGSPGQSYAFSASASNCTAAASGWSWTVGGGGSISGAANGSSIDVSWSTTGSKTVRATNSACGSASGSKSISISSTTPPPPSGDVAAAFSVAPASGKTGQPVSFDASASTGSISSYSWTFGDGGTGNGKNVNHTYAQAGTFTVRLSVGKSGCLSAGCFNSTSKQVVVTDGGTDPEPPPPGDVTAAFEVLPAAPNAGQSVTFDGSASTGDIGSFSWTFGDGATGSGKVVSHTFDQPGTYPVELSVRKNGCLSAGCFVTLTKSVVVGSGPAVGANGCTGGLADDPDKLCLGEGRYIVEVDWVNQHRPERPNGEGQVRRLGGSESTGFFWFFNPDSIDLIIKIIDGSVVNDHVWVFFGGLSDVIYEMRVTDTLTAKTKTYKNLAGTVCGAPDTTAFSTAGLTAPATASTATAGQSRISAEANEASEVLHLLDGRFRVTVNWENHHVPAEAPFQTGAGRSITGTDGSGYFWFFEPSSLDLVVKMIDARAFDGHFWVFYGSLTDVKYSLLVEDLVTGETWTREKPKGMWCGGYDVAAFPPLTD